MSNKTSKATGWELAPETAVNRWALVRADGHVCARQLCEDEAMMLCRELNRLDALVAERDGLREELAGHLHDEDVQQAERDRLRGHTLRLAEKADQQMRMLADAKQREDRLRAALMEAVRVHDLTCNVNGYQRDSWYGTARAALEGRGA